MYEHYEQYNPIEWVNEVIPFSGWKNKWQEYVYSKL